MSHTAADGIQLREVSPIIGEMIVRYVERSLGVEAATTVVRSLLPDASADDLFDPDRWYSVDELQHLAAAAAAITGDREIGRRIGEELFRFSLESGFLVWMHAAGSIPAATELVLQFGSKMSSGRLLSLGRVAEDHLVFTGTFMTDLTLHHDLSANGIFCDLLLGYYAQVPSLFGYMGTAVETQCQLRGAVCCEFRLAWRPDPRVETPGVVDSAKSAARAEDSIVWFENMQSVASDLVAVDDVDGVLERIMGHVSVSLAAPQYLLVVDPGDGRLRVHSVGFSPAQADAFATRLLTEVTERGGDTASVPVRFGDRHFGQLAAVFAPGTAVTEIDERLLAAYASHAGAALNVIASLQAARRDRDTAEALLTLARSLADVVTAADIADRVCAAVPHVIECDGAAVLLYDQAADTLALAAISATVELSELPTHVLAANGAPELRGLVEHPVPILVRASTASESLQPHIAAFGVASIACVPILYRGAFLGVVTAGFTDEHAVDANAAHELFGRMAGLADHAATALENAKLLDHMRREALHDAITGLPNRVLIEDRGRQAFAASSRTHTGVGLLFIDLDRFKNVNDTLGHHAGDELIRAVADRLQATMRDGDTVARLGGDEFVVLLPAVDGADDCVLVANRLIDALRAPFTIYGQELFISCSVGIACSPEHGSTYDSLLQYADSAMYAAKHHGGGTFALDAAAIATPRRQQLRLESQLHRALENDELRVHYQPQIELDSGRVVGAEALVRWQHPTEGLLLPGAFLPLAEESGLVVAIDEWVRLQAFQQARQWCDQGEELRVAVNLGARTLANPALASVIAAELAASGAAAHLIELEINENVAMCDVEELPAALAPLRALGVRVAIDDFGTGSSVLRRLQHCEIDTLKIDRSFIAAVTPTSFEVPLIKALLAMARSLELTVVAEGVETDVQAELLTRYGCELAQGWLFGAAVPADAFRLTLQPTTV